MTLRGDADLYHLVANEIDAGRQFDKLMPAAKPANWDDATWRALCLWMAENQRVREHLGQEHLEYDQHIERRGGRVA